MATRPPISAATMNVTSSKSSESDLFKICRCCLSKNYTEGYSTEYYDFGANVAYNNMLKTVFHIQFQETHTHSKQYICLVCVGKLCDASSFRTMVMQNDELYLKCLENYQKATDLQDTDLKKEEQAASNTNCDMFQDNDSFDDDEVLANLKLPPSKEDSILEVAVLNVERKRTRSDNVAKEENKKRKKKRKIKEDETELRGHETTKVNKLTERRGMAPILRDNSLKILANSTAVVFQWNKSRYRCFVCKEPFTDINLLKSHTSQVHTLEDVEKKIINEQNRLVKVEISSLVCKICNNEIDSLDNLIAHLKNHSFVVNEHLLVPFRIESDLKCQICLESFVQFRLLNMHVNKHFQNHVCHVCGAGFSNSVFLNLHRSRSHRPIHCLKCNLTFMKKSDKKHHDIEKHELVFQRKYRYPCPFCPERFFQENFKVRHLVEKHGLEKPEFACIFCPKTFITKSLLNNHVKVVHMKEKNHECDVCHNLFYTKSDVVRHRVTHTGEKKFSCEMCNSPFASKDSLRRHMRRTHAQ